MPNKQATRQKIMTAFIRLLEQQGYQATTTKQLAAAAGVNESTIYRHFSGKWAMVEEFARQELVTMEQVASQFHPVYELSADLDQFSRLVNQSPLHQQAIWTLSVTIADRQQVAEFRRQLISSPKTLLTVLENYLAEMKRRGLVTAAADERVAAMALIWATASQTLTSNDIFLAGIDVDEAQFKHQVLAGFVRALRADAPSKAN